jgi:hypothetical protein
MIAEYFVLRDARPNPRWAERPYWRDWREAMGPLRTANPADARLFHHRELGAIHASVPGSFELIPVNLTVTPENASCVS